MADRAHPPTVPVEFATPLTTPEAARRLGIDVRDVYNLIFRGALRGGPDRRGCVVVDADAVEQLLTETAEVGDPQTTRGSRSRGSPHSSGA